MGKRKGQYCQPHASGFVRPYGHNLPPRINARSAWWSIEAWLKRDNTASLSTMKPPAHCIVGVRVRRSNEVGEVVPCRSTAPQSRRAQRLPATAYK